MGTRPPFSGRKDSKNAFFEMMDSEGRGHQNNVRSFWKARTREEIIGYSKWLARKHAIGSMGDFARIAPYMVTRYVRMNGIQDEIGIPVHRRASKPAEVPAPKADPQGSVFERMDSEGRGKNSAAFWQKQEENSKEEILNYCRWLIKAEKISARARFGRLAPAYVAAFVRREQKWEEIGLPDHRIEDQIKKRTERKEREMENAQKRLDFLQNGKQVSYGRKEDDPYLPLASLPSRTPFCPVNITPPLPQPKFRLWKNANESERRNMVSELFEAAMKGELHNLMLLLKMGIPADARNKSGETALMQAAFYRHTNLCRALLEHGADPRARNKHGENVLSYAKDGERQEIIGLIRDAPKKQK